MLLTQRQVEVFHAVMVNGGVTAAATALTTSQPTISRELALIEAYIGFRLFDRKGRRLIPTPQGLQLHEIVQRSFVALAEISRAATAIANNKIASLRIGCLPAYAEVVMPEALKRFLQRAPDVQVTLHCMEEAVLRLGFSDGLYDILVTESPFDGVEFDSHQITAGNMMCVLPQAHRLVRQEVIDPQDLSAEPFVFLAAGDVYRAQTDAIFASQAVARTSVLETTTAASVCAMVAAGLGVSIVNPLTARFYAGRGVVVRPLRESVPYHLHLTVPRADRKAALAMILVDSLAEAVQQRA